MRVMLVSDTLDPGDRFDTANSIASAKDNPLAPPELVLTCGPEAGFAKQARDVAPDLLVVQVTDLEVFPFVELSGLSAELPVLMVTDDDRPQVLSKAAGAGVNACLPPTALKRFAAAAEWARAQFLASQELRVQLREKEAKLADRIVIERAKGVVMKIKGLPEDTAYHEIRKMAMRRSLPMRAVAEQIIDTADLVMSE